MGHWFAAPQDQNAARRLRAALAETLVPQEEAGPFDRSEQLRKRVKAIRGRLGEVMGMLREGLRRSNE